MLINVCVFFNQVCMVSILCQWAFRHIKYFPFGFPYSIHLHLLDLK